MTTEFHNADDSITGYTPTEDEVTSLRDWFVRYDELGMKARLDDMAEMADFPINLVTDGSDGNAWTGQWSREEFLSVMSQVMGDGSEEMAFESTRVPYFLTGSLAIVFSNATMHAAGQTHRMRYADVLVNKHGRWVFQTMLQGGWADMLNAPTTD